MGCQIGVSREAFADGMCSDEIYAPKPEFRKQPEQATQALAHPRARRAFAGGVATRLAPPVRSRSGLRAGKSRRRPVFLRVSGQQSRFEIYLSRGGSRAGAGGQFLFVPRLCHQRAGHLQASRIHACQAAEKARRQDGVRARLPACIFRAVFAQRRQTLRAFSRWNGLPAGGSHGRCRFVRRQTQRDAA